jgi:hypothetical protein
MALADPDRQQGCVRHLGPATVTAARRIGVRVRPIQELDHDVLKRFALSVGARHAAYFHNGLYFLGEGAPPAIGSVSATRMASMTSCLLARARSQLDIVSHH